jgi:hypothetical protein
LKETPADPPKFDLQKSFENVPESFSLSEMNQTLQRNQSIFGSADVTKRLLGLQVNSRDHQKKKKQLAERFFFILSKASVV